MCHKYHVKHISKQYNLDRLKSGSKKGHQRNANLCGAYARPIDEYLTFWASESKWPRTLEVAPTNFKFNLELDSNSDSESEAIVVCPLLFVPSDLGKIDRPLRVLGPIAALCEMRLFC